MSSASMLVMSCPRNSILPLAGFSIPVIVLMVVLLPAPLAPSRATISPCSTWSEMPFRAWIAPYQVSTPSTLSIAHLRSQVGVDHLLVLFVLLGCPLGDLLAEVQHGNVIGHVH